MRSDARKRTAFEPERWSVCSGPSADLSDAEVIVEIRRLGLTNAKAMAMLVAADTLNRPQQPPSAVDEPGRSAGHSEATSPPSLFPFDRSRPTT